MGKHSSGSEDGGCAHAHARKAHVFSFLVRALAPVAHLMITASLCDPAAASCTADKVYAKTIRGGKRYLTTRLRRHGYAARSSWPLSHISLPPVFLLQPTHNESPSRLAGDEAAAPGQPARLRRGIPLRTRLRTLQAFWAKDLPQKQLVACQKPSTDRRCRRHELLLAAAEMLASCVRLYRYRNEAELGGVVR